MRAYSTHKELEDARHTEQYKALNPQMRELAVRGFTHFSKSSARKLSYEYSLTAHPIARPKLVL